MVEVRINRKSGRIDVPNFGFVVFAEPSSVGKALDRRVRAAELQRRAAYSRALAISLIGPVASYAFVWLLLLFLDHATACIV